jgi:hypothetical protein
MRRQNCYLTAVITALFFVSPTPAQVFGQDGLDRSLNADSSRISIGLSVGPRFAAFWGPDAADLSFYQATESRQTYSLGIQAKYRVSQVWSFQTGLHYVQAGQEYKGISAGERYALRVQLAYLKFPVLAQYRSLTVKVAGRPVSAHLSAGPYFSTLLGAEERITRPTGDETNDLRSIMRTVSWGGQARIGLSTTVPIGRIGIETSYVLGLQDISTSSLDTKNQGLIFALTFDFNI